MGLILNCESIVYTVSSALILGPPQVGRMEIRQKMISRSPSRLAAAIPRKKTYLMNY